MDFKKLRLFIEKFRNEIIAVIFTGYGLYLRFVCLLNREFWRDEIYSLHFMKGAFKPFWQRIHYTDFTYFPGEYIINWPFVSFFKTNKLGIAIPHILFTLLGFYFLYLICKRYFHSIFAWIATFVLVAVHRDLIFHSFELRPYAVLPTLALGVFYFSEQIASGRHRLSLAQKIAIGSLFIFTSIYHVYGSIILFCILAYFLLRELGTRTLGEIDRHNYRFIGVIVIVGTLLFLWYFLGNPYSSKGIGCEVFKYIPDPPVSLFGLIKSVLSCLAGKKTLYFLGIFLVFPFILPFRDRLKQINFLLILIVFPIMVILYIDLLVAYWFMQRQFAWVMPLFAFLIGWCIDSFIGFIQQKRKWKTSYL
ncbi:MAG: hypothetical protein KAS05_03785 [Candidatus Omnitrophica bacterium]|nr:hypothetical protein [Candidatus Omnitrophota bacterium]